MGLLGVPVRTALNVKELAGLIFVEALENDVFREKLGSSLRELVAGVGIQAEVVSVGLTLEVKQGQEHGRSQKILPYGYHDFILLAVIAICSSQPCLVDLSADIPRSNGLRIDEDLLRSHPFRL